MRAFGLLVALALAWTAMSGCDADGAEITEADKERVVEELQGRSFRQFDPHLDVSPRKAVILDFTVGITLWAQYSEEGLAVNEWRSLQRATALKGAGPSIPSASTSRVCTGVSLGVRHCVPTSGVSISVRDLFNEEKISFKLNDPDKVLPSPFPVFGSWTKFNEDEYFN